MDDLFGAVWCLSCCEPNSISVIATTNGPSHHCFTCGPVLRCVFPPDVDAPECYVRSLDELTERLVALLDDDDVPSPDVPPLVIEPSEFRASPHGCMSCGGPVTFLYWTDEREIDGGAQCHRCGDVDLVTFDPIEPKFRPVAMQRLHRED